EILLGIGKYGNKKKHLGSSWSGHLTEEQILYASIDAFLSLCTYKIMIDPNIILKLKKNKSEKIIKEQYKLNQTEYSNSYKNISFDNMWKTLNCYTSIFSGNKPITKLKLVNVVSNSYKPIATKYDMNEIEEIVDLALIEWRKSNLITCNDDIISITKNISESSNTNMNINIDFIDMWNTLKNDTTIFSGYKPIKKKKLINVIFNSYKPFVKKYNIVEIEEIIDSVLVAWGNEGLIIYKDNIIIVRK
ncbi:unnamed protein product, partial [marine sediment metagenome]